RLLLAGAPHLALEQLLAEIDRRPRLLALDPAPDLLARARGLHERQPVARRPLARVGQHLDRVAVLELARKRRDATVHPGAGAVQSDFGMHGECEIDRRRPAWQLLDVPLGGENEDLVLEQVDAEELHEFLRLARLLL